MNSVSLVPRRLQSSYSKAQLKSYCDLLGVPFQASEAKIKQAFYKKSLQHHPDKNPENKESARIFSEINEAYQALIFDRRYADSGSNRHDFSNRWKYTSRNQFRQWERVKPETQRKAANSAWRDVHSIENEEARKRFKDSNDSSWFGRYYDSIVQEDLEHHRKQREQQARLRGGADAGCRLM